MKIIEEFILCEVEKQEINKELSLILNLGKITYDYGLYRNSPEYIFDTKEAAMQYAMKKYEGRGEFTILSFYRFSE